MKDIPTSTPTREEAEVSTKRRLDNLQLSKLYPSPKTYEERRQDEQEREARRLQRQPRHLALSTATRLFVIVGVGSLVFTLVPMLVAWNVISGVFNIVLCVFILLALIKWQTSVVALALYNKGLNDATTLTLYAIVLAPVTAFALYQANTQANLFIMLSLYVLLFLLHFLCVRLLIRFMSRIE